MTMMTVLQVDGQREEMMAPKIHMKAEINGEGRNNSSDFQTIDGNHPFSYRPIMWVGIIRDVFMTITEKIVVLDEDESINKAKSKPHV